MSETVDACPECDGTSGLFSLSAGGFGCRECGARFDEPETRAPRGNTNTRHGLAADLAAADPDEVSAE
jgi:tRNA(Ile2) C34 agmatinyltransferase TiaS